MVKTKFTKISKSIFLLLFSLLFVLNSTCITAYSATPNIPKTFSVAVGGTLQIPADLSGCNGKTKKWSCAGDTIKIGGSGYVTGLSLGTSTAYCSTERGEVAICKVTVVPAANVYISNNSVDMAQNSSYKLNSSVSPSDAIQEVTWKSNNESVASVGSDGMVTSHSANGTAIISCVSQDGTENKAECVVNVYSNTSSSSSGSSSKNTTKKKTTKKKTTSKAKTSTNKTTTKKSRSKAPNILTTKDSSKKASSAKESATTEKTTEKETTTTTTTKPASININTTEDEDFNVFFIDNSNSVETTEYNLEAVSRKREPITINWSETADASGYELYCAKDANEFSLIYDGKECKYEKNIFENGKRYYFYVRAYKFEGNKKVYYSASKIIVIRSVKKSLFSR